MFLSNFIDQFFPNRLINPANYKVQMAADKNLNLTLVIVDDKGHLDNYYSYQKPAVRLPDK